jgi:hypothetical protein
LISIGIKSAEKTLQIIGSENSFLGMCDPIIPLPVLLIPPVLLVAMENPFLTSKKPPETFLPFDHEMTYSAAVHLTMAKTLFPSSTQDGLYSENAHAILDELILWGNRVATARKQELSRIEDLFQKLAERVEQEGLLLLTLSDAAFNPDASVGSGPFNTTSMSQSQYIPIGRVSTADNVRLGAAALHPSSAQQDNQSVPADPPATAPNLDFLANIGISSYEFHSIIDQINNPEILSGGDMDMSPDWSAAVNTSYSSSLN